MKEKEDKRFVSEKAKIEALIKKNIDHVHQKHLMR